LIYFFSSDIVNDKPALSCPENIPVTLQKDVTSINITDTYGSLITSDGEVTISPTMVYPSINKIGEHDIINVKAMNEFGLESSCNFLVNYPGEKSANLSVLYTCSIDLNYAHQLLVLGRVYMTRFDPIIPELLDYWFIVLVI